MRPSTSARAGARDDASVIDRLCVALISIADRDPARPGVDRRRDRAEDLPEHDVSTAVQQAD